MASPLDDARIARGMAAQVARLQRDLARGARLIGWKVGFGAPEPMARLGITAPLVGYLLDRGLAASGSTVSFAGWTKPVVEPELCVQMARDLEAGASEADAAAAIGALGPAFELADVDAPADDPEQILAGNIYQRHVMCGRFEPGRRGSVEGLVGTLRVNGTARASATDLEANTGPLPALVRHVADVTAAVGYGLKSGHIVIFGSVVPPLFLEPHHQAVDFEVAPIGTVSVVVAGQDRR